MPQTLKDYLNVEWSRYGAWNGACKMHVRGLLQTFEYTYSLTYCQGQPLNLMIGTYA